jgi:hypothetical protein
MGCLGLGVFSLAAISCEGAPVVPRRDLGVLSRAKSSNESSRTGQARCGPGDRRTYYRDADGDGYGDKSKPVEKCVMPPGFVDNPDDCYDANRRARPDQKDFFAVHRGDGSFDYDCDGRATRRFTDRAYCREKEAGGCALASGWTGKGVPGCGEPAEFAWMTCREQVLVKPIGGPDAGLATHSAGAVSPGATQKKLYQCGGRPLPWLKRQLCR